VIFYIDIEFTGANHQFYSKHEYRHYLMNIFEVLWELEEYRDEMKAISKENVFERFINLVMNDTTYCVDEGLNGLIKGQELQKKKSQGQPLSEEEEKNLEMFENSSTYYLQHGPRILFYQKVYFISIFFYRHIFLSDLKKHLERD